MFRIQVNTSARWIFICVCLLCINMLFVFLRISLYNRPTSREHGGGDSDDNDSDFNDAESVQRQQELLQVRSDDDDDDCLDERYDDYH